MITLKRIARAGEGWQDYRRIAADAHDGWDPDDEPADPALEHFLAADERGRSIGLFALRHTDHDFVYINNVAISSDVRGRTYGQQLLKAFEQAVHGRYDGAWLHCASHKAPFYASVGYSPTSDAPPRPDFITMAKRFG